MAETIRRVEQMGHTVRVLPIDARSVVDLAACEAVVDEHTALVSCMQVSNETGAIQPVEALAKLARRKNPNARIHVDGVQGFMRVPMHMERMGVDLYALSGHKIHGPKGIGVLAVRPGVRLIPQITGGGQEKDCVPARIAPPAILGLGGAENLGGRQKSCGADARDEGASLGSAFAGGRRPPQRAGAGGCRQRAAYPEPVL